MRLASLDRVELGSRPTQIGVIDLGSNTARLVVYESTPDAGLRIIAEWKDVPRLGKGTAADGSLSEEAMERGLSSLRRFARSLRSMDVARVVAVATSAVRDAPNGADFLRRVEREIGIATRVLTGEEEARYAFLGVASAFELKNDLVFDLGGGSLQIVRVESGKPVSDRSLPLGALRLTERYLEHDPPKKGELEELRSHVRHALREASEILLPAPRRLFGVGGTIRSLARAAIEITEYPLPQLHGYGITRRDLEAIGDLLLEMSAARRREVPGISGSRSDVIVAGLVTVRELLSVTEARQLIACGTGIREGIALESQGAALPAPAQVLAYRSVVAAARSFGFSLPHGEEVRRRAIELFDRLDDRKDSDPESRLALEVAAWMHDVGAVIEPAHHPEHSAYILRNSRILGLTHREVLLASIAASLHEGAEPPARWHKEFRPLLSEEALGLAGRLGAVLFFAETLSGTGASFSVRSGPKGAIVVSGHRGAQEPVAPKALSRLDRVFQRTWSRKVESDVG